MRFFAVWCAAILAASAEIAALLMPAGSRRSQLKNNLADFVAPLNQQLKLAIGWFRAKYLIKLVWRFYDCAVYGFNHIAF